METNGTRDMRLTAGRWTTVTTSPKVIPSAGQVGGPVDPATLHPSVLTDPATDYKFVVADEGDLTAVLQWVERYDIDRARVWVMPEGITAATLDERAPWLMDRATHYGLNFSSRLHVYGWADVRGH